MAPPSLFKTTTTTGRSRSMASELRSCRSARSPMRSVTGRPEPRAKPAAVATVPSMPLAPRLAATGTGAPSGAAKVSRSLIGMLLATQSPCPSGTCRETRRATSGSFNTFVSSRRRSRLSSACSEAVRQPDVHVGSPGNAVRPPHLAQRRDPQRRPRRCASPCGRGQGGRGFRARRRRGRVGFARGSDPASWRPRGRRYGAPPRGVPLIEEVTRQQRVVEGNDVPGG